MTILGGILSLRLTKIDQTTLADHCYLTEGDHCYYLTEYTARKGFNFSRANQLVLNFKKPVSARNRPEWRYKEQAIAEAANGFRGSIKASMFDTGTLVPIPPSKARHDPEYDDRVVRMIQAIRADPPLDIRELILQPLSTEPVHQSERRPRPEDIQGRYQLDNRLAVPHPQWIALVDDVLTTGAHFKAAQTILNEAFPEVPVIGLFIARRVPDTMEFEDLT